VAGAESSKPRYSLEKQAGASEISSPGHTPVQTLADALGSCGDYGSPTCMGWQAAPVPPGGRPQSAAVGGWGALEAAGGGT